MCSQDRSNAVPSHCAAPTIVATVIIIVVIIIVVVVVVIVIVIIVPLPTRRVPSALWNALQSAQSTICCQPFSNEDHCDDNDDKPNRRNGDNNTNGTSCPWGLSHRADLTVTDRVEHGAERR